MICFKGCKSEIDRLNDECKEAALHLKMASNIIQERDDIITNLTCKFKDEKLSLLQQIDQLQIQVAALELEKAKAITKVDSEPQVDWVTTSSSDYNADDSDWNNDRQVTHSEEVPVKRPYNKRQSHLRKEKNRL